MSNETATNTNDSIPLGKKGGRAKYTLQIIEENMTFGTMFDKFRDTPRPKEVADDFHLSLVVENEGVCSYIEYKGKEALGAIDTLDFLHQMGIIKEGEILINDNNTQKSIEWFKR